MGKMYGSIHNRLAENSKQPKPEVGMGVTVMMYTDRKAGTIRDVHVNGKRFWFTIDKAIRTDKNGMSECQDYTYEDQPNSQIYEAYLNKHGVWKIRNKKNGPGLGGTGLAIGYRRAYHDFSF